MTMRVPPVGHMAAAALAMAGAMVGIVNADSVVKGANRTERAALGQMLPTASGIPAGTDALWASALRSSALDANALWAGAVRLEATDRARSTKLAALAGRMTRRHFPAQAWLLEQDIARGDVAATLQQYDILLTIWPEGRPRLIGQLVLVAREDPQVARALLMFSRRPWYRAFLAEAARQDGGLFTEHLRRFAGHLSGSAGTAEHVAYLMTLLANGQARAAANQVLTDPAVPDELVTDFSPTELTTDPRWAPLAWTLTSTPGAAATVVAGTRGIRLDADGDAVATLLTRTTLLKAGRYRLRLAFRVEPSSDAPFIGWAVRCNQDQSPITGGDIDPNRTPERMFALNLPRACEAQRWSITIINKYDSRSSVIISTLELQGDPTPDRPAGRHVPGSELN